MPTDLGGAAGGDDGAADNVTVEGTNEDDVAQVGGDAARAQVSCLHTLVPVVGASATT